MISEKVELKNGFFISEEDLSEMESHCEGGFLPIFITQNRNGKQISFSRKENLLKKYFYGACKNKRIFPEATKPKNTIFKK